MYVCVCVCVCVLLRACVHLRVLLSSVCACVHLCVPLFFCMCMCALEYRGFPTSTSEQIRSYEEQNQLKKVSIIAQQDETIYSFVIFLQTALHVSDDTLIHHQEHTQTVITTSGTG